MKANLMTPFSTVSSSSFSSSMQKGKNGFGLSNVNRRLKLFYGTEYGLEMRSVPGCTENVIILPVDILW